MDERPSGWYDDPDDPDQLRYFDGILWSDRRTPKHKPGLDRARNEFEETPDPEPAAQARPDPGWSARPGTPAAGTPGRQAEPPPTTPEGQRLSGWWRRFAGWFIDWVLVSIIGTLCALPWMGTWLNAVNAWVDRVVEADRNGQSMPQMPQSVAQLPAAWALSIVVVFAVYDIGLTSWRGRTLGKLITRTSVRRVDEAEPPSLNDAALRFLVKGLYAILSVVPAVGALGTFFMIVDGLWPLNNRLRQALHDKAGRTIVVIGPVTPGPEAPQHRPPSAGAAGYDRSVAPPGAPDRPEQPVGDLDDPWKGPRR